jgi:succinate-semialdehyde dehydrogenase/glutarate-semialdehyde dehydrogenase
MLAKFRNIGQACTAANRFLVHESVAKEFAARLTGRVSELRVGRGTHGADIGPLIDGRAVANLTALVADAVARGARVLTGGTPLDGPGNFFNPTVLVDVSAESRLVHEEIFGPVLAITTFATEEEGVRQANATEYGLVGYVFTRDLARAHRMIDLIDTGMMGINTGLVSNAAAPFGGVKQSGVGREGGAEGISEYLETKYTLVPAD